MNTISRSGSPSPDATAANWNKEAGGGLLDRLKAKLGIGKAPVLSTSPNSADLKAAAMESFDARLKRMEKPRLTQANQSLARESMRKFLDTHLGADTLQGKSSSAVRSQMRSVDKVMDSFASALKNLSDTRASSSVSDAFSSKADEAITKGISKITSEMNNPRLAKMGDIKDAITLRQIDVMAKLRDVEIQSDKQELRNSMNSDADVRAQLNEAKPASLAAKPKAAPPEDKPWKFPGQEVGYVSPTALSDDKGW